MQEQSFDLLHLENSRLENVDQSFKQGQSKPKDLDEIHIIQELLPQEALEENELPNNNSGSFAPKIFIQSNS
jgi:hypothetical protein